LEKQFAGQKITEGEMAGPQPKKLTERELVVMRVFWDESSGRADEARYEMVPYAARTH